MPECDPVPDPLIHHNCPISMQPPGGSWRPRTTFTSDGTQQVTMLLDSAVMLRKQVGCPVSYVLPACPMCTHS